MKKITSFFAIAFALIGMSKAQMVIAGEQFSKNPAQYNGRQITIKNIQLDFSNNAAAPAGAVAPAPHGGAPSNAPQAPGPNGQGAQTIKCNPPKGFVSIDVDFIADPEYKGCFFISQAQYNQLKTQAGGQRLDAQITFKGDNRMGYNITLFKIGK